MRTQAVSFGAFSTLLQKVRVEIGHVKHGEHEDACTSVKESERDIFKERERELTGTQKKTRRIKREHKESIKRERERERSSRYCRRKRVSFDTHRSRLHELVTVALPSKPDI